jgi:hypothetical protein
VPPRLELLRLALRAGGVDRHAVFSLSGVPEPGGKSLGVVRHGSATHVAREHLVHALGSWPRRQPLSHCHKLPRLHDAAVHAWRVMLLSGRWNLVVHMRWKGEARGRNWVMFTNGKAGRMAVLNNSLGMGTSTESHTHPGLGVLECVDGSWCTCGCFGDWRAKRLLKQVQVWYRDRGGIGNNRTKAATTERIDQYAAGNECAEALNNHGGSLCSSHCQMLVFGKTVVCGYLFPLSLSRVPVRSATAAATAAAVHPPGRWFFPTPTPSFATSPSTASSTLPATS